MPTFKAAPHWIIRLLNSIPLYSDTHHKYTGIYVFIDYSTTGWWPPKKIEKLMGIDFVTPRIHQASPPQGAASIVACSRESARGSEQCWAKLFPGCAGLPAVLFEIHPGNGADRKEGEINFWNMVDKLVCWPAICQLRSSISKGTTQISDARRQEFFRHCSAPMAFDPVKGRYLKVDSVTNSCPRTLGVNRSGRCYFKKVALWGIPSLFWSPGRWDMM